MESRRDEGTSGKKGLLVGVLLLVVLGLILWQFSPIEGVWWEEGHLVFYLSDAVGQAMWSTHPELQDYFGSDELLVHDTFFSIAGTTLFGYFLAAVAAVTCAFGYWKWKAKARGSIRSAR